MVARLILILQLLVMQLQAQDWYEYAYDVQNSPVELIENDLQPRDLNKVSLEELRSIPTLTRMQADSIHSYREILGPFTSVDELQTLGVFTLQQFMLLKPVFYVAKRSSTETGFLGIIRYGQTIQPRRGYLNQRYLGSPQQIVFRSKYTSDRFRLGLTLEKDPGEYMNIHSIRRRHNHIAGFIELKPGGFVEQVIVGTYQSTWGQGLLLGNGFAMGKGRETIHSLLRNNQSRPYQSLAETNYLTGILTSFRLFRFQLQLLTSFDHLFLTSNMGIYSSGLFRTQNDTSRSTTSRTVMGARVAYQQKSLDLSLAALRYTYENAVSSPLSSGIGLSTSFQWQLRNFLFFGEGVSINRGYALSTGFLAAVSHHADISFSYRSFSDNYHSPFAENTFREGRNVLERGRYIGVRLNLSDHWQLNMFADIFNIGQMEVNNRLDAMAQLSYVNPDFTLQFYTRQRTTKIGSSAKTQVNQYATKRYVNASLNATMNEYISTKIGLWYSHFQESTGRMLHHDLRLKWRRLTIKTRIALIHSPSFDNRFYLYEPDVNFTFYIPPYYGISIRTMILASFKPTRWIKLEAKYAQTSFRDRNEVGSGNELIEGNSIDNLRIQAILTF